MRQRILHISLSFLLLFTYGVERLLPCAGEWDLDCKGEEQVTTYESTDQAGHEHSGDSESHSDGGCVCPCHAPSTPIAIQLIPTTPVARLNYASATFTLFFTTLSPPDHIPIV